ncbi:hypothetical protein L0F63_001159 [Massospora cicadina]|nr:hypothetical protein L0F63_001159 [Massospora cicadina]
MDRYKVTQQVNAGAFGAVFEAYDQVSGRKVAVKRVAKKFYEFNLRQRNREVKTGGSMLFIFEFMDFNLYEIIYNRNGDPFPPELVKAALFQIISGLAFMHASGYFHRDLKPENILVTQNCVKLADFGQAHELKGDAKKLTPHVSTRWYRAPEVLLGYRCYGSAIDLWAVGAIAAEMVTLRPLFPGASHLDQINKICAVLGPPGQASFGGPWPLGDQLAAILGIHFPRCASATLLNSLDVYPHLDPAWSRFIISLLQFDPNCRMTASQALQHELLSSHSQTSLSPSYPSFLTNGSEDLDLGLPAIQVDARLSFGSALSGNASVGRLGASLIRDCSRTPSPSGEPSPYPSPSVPDSAPTHKDIPMQAVYSLPISEPSRHPSKHRRGSISVASFPGFKGTFFDNLSSHGILDFPELRALEIFHSDIEPRELGWDSPSPPEWAPPNATVDVAGIQAPPKASGLRRTSKIPQGNFAALRRLPCDGLGGGHLTSREPSRRSASDRSSLKAELQGLVDNIFGAADASVCELSGSRDAHPETGCQKGIGPCPSLERMAGDKRGPTFLSHATRLPSPDSRVVQPPKLEAAPAVTEPRPRRGSLNTLLNRVRHLFGRGGRPIAPLPCTPGVDSDPSSPLPESC